MDSETTPLLSQNGEAEVEEEKIKFTHRDKLTIGMLAVANLCSTVVFSCIAPFFPQEAMKKGASQTVTGFVFSVFQLTVFIVSPIFGRYITSIGSNFMYGTGLCVTGSTAILFGLLNLAPAGATFIVLAFVVRIVEAVGDAAIVTSSFTIVAKAFTARVATIIGIMETFGGLGFTVGPPLGGVLYEAGGYQLPFAVLGSFLIVSGLSSFCIVPKQHDTPTQRKGNMFSLLRIQAVWTMSFSTVVAAMSISFLHPTLQPHLNDFNLSPSMVGLMFLVSGGAYALSAPFWGFVIDRRKHLSLYMMLFGCVATFASLMLMGPSPIFPFQKQLWLVAVSQILIGVGLGAMFIPPYQQCLLAARSHGYPDTFETYGLISGLFKSSLSCGSFIGPTIGGIGAQRIGFPWTASIVAFLNIVCAILITILIVSERRRRSKSSRSNLQATIEENVEKSKMIPDDQ